jgi:hypothetical protein
MQMPKKQRKPSVARALVGCEVRYEYNTPAISCFSSHRRKLSGRVASIRHNPTQFFGPNTLVVFRDDLREYVSLKSVTHVKKPGSRWRKFKCPKEE